MKWDMFWNCEKVFSWKLNKEWYEKVGDVVMKEVGKEVVKVVEEVGKEVVKVVVEEVVEVVRGMESEKV